MSRGRSALTAGATWDFVLMTLTVGLMGSLGVQSLAGTVYAWWAHNYAPLWERSGQAAFIDLMNAIAGPQVIALVVVMGLCVPKRLLSRGALIGVSAGMAVLGAAVAVLGSSLSMGLAVYLCAAGVLQVAVVWLTLTGGRGLTYMTESRLAKVGSGLLHLGFIVIALVVVALQRSALMMPVSMVAAALLTVGSALSFYARPASRAPVADDA